MFFKCSELGKLETSFLLDIPLLKFLIYYMGFPNLDCILPGLAIIISAGLYNWVVMFCSFLHPPHLYLHSGLYWRIWHMDLIQSAVLYSVMTLVSTYLVALAYKNVKFVLKHKVAQKREDAVSKEVTRKLSEADNRRMSRKQKR